MSHCDKEAECMFYWVEYRYLQPQGRNSSKYSQITFVMYHKVEKQVLKLSETAAMSKVSPRTHIWITLYCIYIFLSDFSTVLSDLKGSGTQMLKLENSNFCQCNTNRKHVNASFFLWLLSLTWWCLPSTSNLELYLPWQKCRLYLPFSDLACSHLSLKEEGRRRIMHN